MQPVGVGNTGIFDRLCPEIFPDTAGGTRSLQCWCRRQVIKSWLNPSSVRFGPCGRMHPWGPAISPATLLIPLSKARLFGDWVSSWGGLAWRSWISNSVNIIGWWAPRGPPCRPCEREREREPVQRWMVMVGPTSSSLALLLLLFSICSLPPFFSLYSSLAPAMDCRPFQAHCCPLTLP